jgi:hypothetical protein
LPDGVPGNIQNNEEGRMVDYKRVNGDSFWYVETVPGVGRIENENDALDLVAACGEHETSRLLIHGENLSPAFFQLRSGLAGAVLLKFSNYRIKAAVLASPDQVGRGKFYEFVLETNRGRQFGVFFDRDQAEQWLLAE